MVARVVRDDEVAGSNPVTPISFADRRLDGSRSNGKAEGGRRLLVVPVELVADQLAERVDEVIVDLVESGGSALLSADDIRIVEGLEMLGDIRLSQFQLLDKLPDVLLPGGKGLENLQPRGVTEDAEQFGDRFEGIAVRGHG